MRISNWSSDVCSSDLRTIALAETAHQPILLLLDLAGNEERHRGRNQGERQEKSSGQREDDRDRHRVEGLSFDAFEREDRQIDRGDDDDAEDARLDHFGARRGHEAEAFVAIEQPSEPVLRTAKPSTTIFDDAEAQ